MLDSVIVAKKSANKAEHPAAERMEPRTEPEVNVDQQAHAGHRAGSPCPRRWRIRQAARRRKKEQFTVLLRHTNVTLLRLVTSISSEKPRGGVDGMTWSEYGEDLESNLAGLHNRVHRGAYPAYRGDNYIPKPDGRYATAPRAESGLGTGNLYLPWLRLHLC
jgi:RNA-directed DNA polymerase